MAERVVAAIVLIDMTPQPLISICIPTYNQRPEFLRACIASALGQSYTPLEVIVSDNHSTNDTPTVLAQFGDPRLRIVRPPKHVGMSANFAFAALQSSGEILSFLSSDDLLLPNCCAKLSRILQEHPDIAFAYCAIHQIDETGRVIAIQRKSHPSYIRNRREEFQRYVWQGGTWIIGGLIRRTAYDIAGGFGEGFDEVSDWYLALRLLTVGDVAYDSEILASVRIWSNAERRRRLSSLVYNIRRLYEWLGTPKMILQIDGGQTTLAHARRRWAIDIATNLSSHLLPTEEKTTAMHEVRLLDDSVNVRIRLWLSGTIFAPVLIGWSKALNWLRHQAARWLYQLRSRKNAK